MLTKEGIMLKWQSMKWIATLGVVSVLAAHAQPKSTKATTLTALDYAEIQQLNTHYAQALDSCADNGREWANLFTPDGVFIAYNGTTEGRKALAALAGSPQYCAPPMNPLTVNHISVNVMIEPSSEGAIGKSYLVFVDIGKDGYKGELVGAGKYYDVYVKTPEGWRIKSRTWARGQDINRIPASELLHHPLPR